MRETFCKVHQEGVYLQSRMIRFQFNSVKTTELSEIQDHAMESAWLDLVMCNQTTVSYGVGGVLTAPLL